MTRDKNFFKNYSELLHLQNMLRPDQFKDVAYGAIDPDSAEAKDERTAIKEEVKRLVESKDSSLSQEDVPAVGTAAAFDLEIDKGGITRSNPASQVRTFSQCLEWLTRLWPAWCTRERSLVIIFWAIIFIFLILLVTRIIIVEEHRHGELWRESA